MHMGRGQGTAGSRGREWYLDGAEQDRCGCRGSSTRSMPVPMPMPMAVALDAPVTVPVVAVVVVVSVATGTGRTKAVRVPVVVVVPVAMPVPAAACASASVDWPPRHIQRQCPIYRRHWRSTGIAASHRPILLHLHRQIRDDWRVQPDNPIPHHPLENIAPHPHCQCSDSVSWSLSPPVLVYHA